MLLRRSIDERHQSANRRIQLMSIEEFNTDWLSLKDGIYRLAFYMLESQDDAEDAVQDLYVKLWNTRDTLDHIYNPKAYCTTLIKRICIDRIRRHSGEMLNDDILSDSRGAEQELIDKERLRKVQNLIEKLPDRERLVLKLKVIDELSYEQIAQKTGINYLSLRVLISNARRKIKAAI